MTQKTTTITTKTVKIVIDTYHFTDRDLDEFDVQASVYDLKTNLHLSTCNFVHLTQEGVETVVQSFKSGGAMSEFIKQIVWLKKEQISQNLNKKQTFYKV